MPDIVKILEKGLSSELNDLGLRPVLHDSNTVEEWVAFEDASGRTHALSIYCGMHHWSADLSGINVIVTRSTTTNLAEGWVHHQETGWEHVEMPETKAGRIKSIGRALMKHRNMYQPTTDPDAKRLRHPLTLEAWKVLGMFKEALLIKPFVIKAGEDLREGFAVHRGDKTITITAHDGHLRINPGNGMEPFEVWSRDESFATALLGAISADNPHDTMAAAERELDERVGEDSSILWKRTRVSGGGSLVETFALVHDPDQGELLVVTAWATGDRTGSSIRLRKNASELLGTVEEMGELSQAPNELDIEVIKLRQTLQNESVVVLWSDIVDGKSLFVARTAKVGREEQIVCATLRRVDGNLEVECERIPTVGLRADPYRAYQPQ